MSTMLRLKTDEGWRVSCDWCSAVFGIPYRINVTRAARPKFCSMQCRRKNMVANTTDPATLFWAKVDRRGAAECWPWHGYIRASGYGWFNFGGKTMTANRAAYILTNGPIDPTTLFVCHTCDNPLCCNPAHLWLGTAAQNNLDCLLKGRHRSLPPKGEDSPNAKLTRNQAVEAFHSALPAKELAAQWGVAPQSIENIRQGKTWSHATGVSRR